MACLWAPQSDCFSLERRDQESWSRNQKKHTLSKDAGMRGAGLIGSQSLLKVRVRWPQRHLEPGS